MIRQTFDAIFENGVFRPLEPSNVPVSEGQQVRIIIETAQTAEEILEVAANVYDGLTEEQINEIEQIALNRQDFFGDEAQI
jgi:predicted DNA-binding antitoxin AbrB/MazE fold protein